MTLSPTLLERWMSLAGRANVGPAALAPSFEFAAPPSRAPRFELAPPSRAPSSLVADEPEHVRLLREGRAAAARGDTDAALAALDVALRLDPHLGVAHLCRALCLLQQGDEEGAARAMTRAVEVVPDDADAQLGLARVCAAAGMTPLALRLVGAALERRPGLTDAVFADAAFASLRDHPQLLQMAGLL